MYYVGHGFLGLRGIGQETEYQYPWRWDKTISRTTGL